MKPAAQLSREIAEVLARPEGTPADGKQPLYGRWVVPGGTVELGEGLEQALVREMREETGLEVEPVDSAARWSIGVSDRKAAEAQLLRLILASADVNVMEFGRKQYDLEEVFLNIVGGDSHVCRA